MKNMKYIHTIAAGLLLCAGLASCEMKEELQGGSETSDKGFLNLNVSVNAKENTVVTKANDDISDDGENPGSPVSADDFPVELVCTTNPEYSRTFESYAALQEEIPVELSVGEYTITAHSDEKLQPQMSVPYYEGNDDIKITKDVEAEATVVCTMKNTKIVIRYGDVFLANFTSWDISIDDGSSNILSFDETDTTNPAPIYWLIEEGQSEIKVNITATKSDGTSISDSRTLTKPEGGNTAYWTGGDALTITMEGLEPTPGNPTGVTGIEISANVTFQELPEDNIEVPVTGGDDNPTPPGPNPDPTEEIVISDNGTGYLTNGVTVSGTPYPTVSVSMSVPNGIKNVYVVVSEGSEDFLGAVGSFGLASGDGLDLASEAAKDLSALFSLPQVDAKEYTFTMNDGIFNLLCGFPGKQSFTLKVIDNEDNEKSATLSITVNATTSGE